MMQLSAQGAAFTKGWEQCRLVCYLDEDGNWTNGWGHKCESQVADITQEQADAQFVTDMEWPQSKINSWNIPIPMGQGYFDALCDQLYNDGNPGPHLMAAIMAQNWTVVEQEMLLYCHDSRGEIVSDLQLRCRRRVQIMQTGVYDSSH
jgi:GH24 family phage-related lysozyme (muramidase)